MRLPTPWLEDFAILSCQVCGNPVGVSSQFSRTWEAAETLAAQKYELTAHTCPPKWKFSEDNAKRMMKLWRSRNPNASFEESCRVYNELIVGGTIVL